ncbi:gamma-mobile-trio protein GmtX [Paraburkholderia sp. FT54]|uniref:gamma-mobile-trio protein GmtX n=1 Tax=Paraburkholderia sp. FT54 TaxID=3074437 RepID=UPI002877472F|nr:gamma-mobile-trio protein GmtX [Paraburkholderia sp. FT54]WNC89444.1 gamma-mobile-trio protein GmtX [Paraburkholderia sp. FT54]
MSPSNLSPEEVLAALQQDATKRTRQSLELIHTLCKEQYEAGNLDFSVATIGRLSAARGGPSTGAIHNSTGEHYRALLKAWANHANGATRKPAVRPEPGVADDVLAMIPDASVRALVGSFLAENRKLRAENTLLKSQAQVVIDRRPKSAMSESTSQSGVQVLPALSTLLPLEVDALRHALSEELLAKMGWRVDAKTGRVSKDGHAIFRAGFATAIKKVLNAV